MFFLGGGSIRVKKRTFLDGLIIGEGESQFFSELHTKCEVLRFFLVSSLSGRERLCEPVDVDL